MRYDILSAITSGIEPSRISFNLEKSSIIRTIREMLPVELENNIESIFPERIKFKAPEHNKALETYYASEKFQNKDGYDIIIFSSDIEDDDVILKSDEMISFKEKGNYNYSALETFIGKEIILFNCARVKMIDKVFNSANVYTFIYDKKILDIEEGKEILKLLKGDSQITDFLDELVFIKKKLKEKFIIPDFYEGISFDFSKKTQIIDIDGEEYENTLEIFNPDSINNNKAIISSLVHTLNDSSAIGSFAEIEEWKEKGICYKIFNSKCFMEKNLSTLEQKTRKENSFQKVKK